jgi:hypothetical protein
VADRQVPEFIAHVVDLAHRAVIRVPGVMTATGTPTVRLTTGRSRS